MARIVKEKEYAEKRNEILDVAQQLVYTKGFEQMTIQDILDRLQISKGAFYHYFDSKLAVLEALIERMALAIDGIVSPVVDDSDLPALEKLTRFFTVAGKWKVEQKAFLAPIMRIWYMDENILVRQKSTAMGVKFMGRFLSKIINQGIEEGVFLPRYPEQVSGLVMQLILNAGDTMALEMLSDHPIEVMIEQLRNMNAVYTDAVERVLGAKPGSMNLVDLEILKKWVVEPEAQPSVPAEETVVER
jgi:AcrR family transcriptional regulator